MKAIRTVGFDSTGRVIDMREYPTRNHKPIRSTRLVKKDMLRDWRVVRVISEVVQ